MSSWEQVPNPPWRPVAPPPNVVSVGSRKNIWGVNTVTGVIYQWHERDGYWQIRTGESTYPPAAAADGSVFCVNTFQGIDMWEGSWISLPASSTPECQQVVAGSVDNLWALDTSGESYQYDATSHVWHPMGNGIAYLAVAQDGTVLALGNVLGAAVIFQYSSTSSEWEVVKGPEGVEDLTQIAVVNQGVIWAIDSSGTIYRLYNNAWEVIEGYLTSLSAASDNTVWGTDGSQILRFCSCPPISALTSLTLGVSPDSIVNYNTLSATAANGSTNAENGYGMTGLMVVDESAGNECYGSLSPGTVFLFPGISITDNPDPEPYANASLLKLNCESQDPLRFSEGGATMHAQMCKLLGLDPSYFIGFSLTYPWVTTSGVNINYHSGTCNVRWFGSRDIPSCSCNRINWRNQIMAALASL